MGEYTKDIQRYSLELLRELADVCDKNGLRYYLMGGTLLGAVRHKGFIPWDDDIDVAMPRKDYEILIKNADKFFKKPYSLYHYTRESGNIKNMMIALLTNADVSVSFLKNGKTVNDAVEIDIVPVDGTPDNIILRKMHYFRLLALRALYKFTYSDELEISGPDKRNGLERFLIQFAKITKIGKLFDSRKMLERLETALKKYSLEDSPKIAGTFLSAYKLREFVDSKYFTDREKYSFEGCEFYGTKFYDGYLKCIYGDYMTMPPESERVGKKKILKIEKLR